MCAYNPLPLYAHSSGQVFLTEVRLTSAQRGLSPPASWVETCSCPKGYTGQFCESCAPGYKRETPLGGPYTNCVPCTCNQHGTCDPHTGESWHPIQKPPGLHPAQPMPSIASAVCMYEGSPRSMLIKWYSSSSSPCGDLSVYYIIDARLVSHLTGERPQAQGGCSAVGGRAAPATSSLPAVHPHL